MLPVVPRQEGMVLAGETLVLRETPLRPGMPPLQGNPPPRETPTARGALPIESVTPVYFETGCDGAAHGRHIIGGHCELHAAAGFNSDRSRLSHYPSAPFLSGRESRCGGHNGDCTVRAAVWPAPGTEPDDVQQLGRHLR